MQIPGKEEFRETIRYFANQIDETGVKLHLETDANFDLLVEYDEVVMASGVEPRKVKIDGIDNPEKVIDYQTLIKEKTYVGESCDCWCGWHWCGCSNHADRASWSQFRRLAA